MPTPVPGQPHATNPAAVAGNSSLRPKNLRRRRRVSLRRREEPPKTSAGFSAEIAHQVRAYSKGDKEVEQQILRHVNAILSPRKPRTSEKDTIMAAELRMNGQEWESIYATILGDRWKYRSAQRKKLRRNAKRYMKQRMRQDGAPVGMSTSEWIKRRRFSRS